MVTNQLVSCLNLINRHLEKCGWETYRLGLFKKGNKQTYVFPHRIILEERVVASEVRQLLLDIASAPVACKICWGTEKGSNQHITRLWFGIDSRLHLATKPGEETVAEELTVQNPVRWTIEGARQLGEIPLC